MGIDQRARRTSLDGTGKVPASDRKKSSLFNAKVVNEAMYVDPSLCLFKPARRFPCAFSNPVAPAAVSLLAETLISLAVGLAAQAAGPVRILRLDAAAPDPHPQG